MGKIYVFPRGTDHAAESVEELLALKGMFEFARRSAEDIGDPRLERACNLCCALVEEALAESTAPL